MNRVTFFVKNIARNSLGIFNNNADINSVIRTSVSQFSTNHQAYASRAVNTNLHNSLKEFQSYRNSIISVPLLNVEPIQTLQIKRHKWYRSSMRVGRGPRSNNGKRSPLTIQGAFQCHPYKKKFKKTLSRRFPGHVDVYNRKG